MSMTITQKTLLAATLLAAVATGLYQMNRASRLTDKLQSLKAEHAPVSLQIEQMRQQHADVLGKLERMQMENEELRRSVSELPRLRGEISRLRRDSEAAARLQAEAADGSGPGTKQMKSWLSRVDRLKEALKLSPDHQIPEMKLLSEEDWLSAAKGELKTEEDYRRALSSLRSTAQSKFAAMATPALKRYMDANNQRFPTSIGELHPYFEPPIDDAILKRYGIVPADTVKSIRVGGEWVITQIAPVDEEFDARIGIGPNGYGSTGAGFNQAAVEEMMAVLGPVLKAFADANQGREPTDPSQLAPYLRTKEQRLALENLQQTREFFVKQGVAP